MKSESARSTTSFLPQPKRLALYRRLFSTLILWSGVLWTLFSTHRDWADPLLGIMVVIMVGIGLKEYFRFLKAQDTPHFQAIGIMAGCLLTFLEFYEGSPIFPLHSLDPGFVKLVLGVALVHILLLCGVFSHGDFNRSIIAISSTCFGVIYVSVLFNFMLRIYFHPEVNGQFLVFCLILVTKSSDAGAYLIGSWLGKRPMVPSISPGKTWEGFIGALVVPVILCVIIRFLSPHDIQAIPVMVSVMLGILFGLGAVAGDLVESLFKRQSGIKDSGNIIPGIGGMLDLLDSLLFNAPLLYFIIELFIAFNGMKK